MKIQFNNIGQTYFLDVQKKEHHSCAVSNSIKTSSDYNQYLNQLGIINKAAINFKGYYGDLHPAKKLFYMVSGRNTIYEDNWTNSHLYQAGWKKWVNAHPIDLLKRSAEQAIQSICTLTKLNCRYPEIPDYIPSPNYGNNWGRHANYIEINPRAIAKYENGKVTDGLLQTIKLLPAIPASSNKAANCIILSQLYPTWYGDGTTGSVSQYCTNLHYGISKNLTSDWLEGKMGEDEQVKAFNDLAHMLGFKTGFRMMLPAGQLSVQGRPFNWQSEERAFIDACKWGVDLGFDAIYFDSAKHIVDMNGFCGNGSLPTPEQMANITMAIRKETGRHDLSFIGEKCYDRPEYEYMGFTAGTDWGRADDIGNVKHEARKQAWRKNYAAGPEVSNDNDDGAASFDTRYARLISCLFGYDNVEDKLPAYMQLNDIMPYAPGINAHNLMLYTIKTNKELEHWNEPECDRHWNGMFDLSPYATHHRNRMYNLFEAFIKNHG